MKLKCFSLLNITILILLRLAESHKMEFTNVKCSTLDKKFGEFEYCFLKAANRTYKYLSLKVRLYKVPVHKFSVNVAFHKRSNGLSPVNYNITFDGCKMVEKIGNPWITFLFGVIKEYSNINHSCPYAHDIIVDKLPAQFLKQRFSALLPFPEGDYVFNSNWIAYGINRANVRVHFSYT
ncbi:uncharacterized protein LOC108033274 [Drosophila biarmipes]|uniref:uncharacterized protein LOC108033274 n=1 Tax=Drosophila biarmipes TaxID=125945 RepID=UPI0007E70D12|nr:uncharacterized protein LOC108033274 [Drosophila biarmipes]